MKNFEIIISSLTSLFGLFFMIFAKKILDSCRALPGSKLMNFDKSYGLWVFMLRVAGFGLIILGIWMFFNK